MVDALQEQVVGADTVQEEKELSELAGKYLTFKLAGEEYAIDILKVREIIGLMPITDVPRMPGYVRGVINLRGKVIPVVDLRAKFGLMSTEDTDETCIIVVDAARNGKSTQTGILIDTVSEVLDIAADQIEEAPSFGTVVNTDFIMGMGKIGESVKILLDVVKVLL
jgi:purine-binding chemotaxis protein CheW